MDIHGELKAAQLEQGLIASPPSPGVGGQVFADVTTPAAIQPYFFDGTAWRKMLLPNGLIAPTKQLFTATGATQTGSIITCSSANATIGATYSNGGSVYTVLQTIASGTTLWISGLNATTGSGTLTKQSGTGDATITFSAAQALATYLTPAGANLIKVTIIGGGGGGGGTATGSGASGAGQGGGGGAALIKWIAGPSASYFYAVGTGGAGGPAGTNNGSAGLSSFFGTVLLSAGGGQGGAGSGATSAVTPSQGTQTLAIASGGDANIPGGPGGAGFIFGVASAIAGPGGGSLLAQPSAAISAVVSSAGSAGNNYGGGGGGAQQTNNSGTKAGGNGAGGFVLIEEFYQ